MPVWYLDSSIALHALLPAGDPRAADWLEDASRRGDLYSSTLLELEMVRVLRREGLAPSGASEVLERVTLVSVDDGVLRAAGAIVPHVRSLDAIHLATCALLGDAAVIVTDDARMLAVARELGRATVNPLAVTGQTLDG